MKCPDCGTTLSEQPSNAGVIGRCFKCGGFWLDAGTANNLTPAELANWRRISVSSAYLSGGSGVCPADGQKLAKYTGEQVPVNIVVKHCDRCGKWWFPGDNLYKFKPALEAKKNYLKLWGLPLTSGVLLPMALVAFLAGGTAVGVKMVGQRQQTAVSAKSRITEFSGSYSGGGRAMVVFKSDQETGGIEYRVAGDKEWRQAKMEMVNGYYVSWLENLTEGKGYTVRISGEEYKFEAK